MPPAEWVALGNIDPEFEQFLKSLPPGPPPPTDIQGIRSLLAGVAKTAPSAQSTAEVDESDTTVPGDGFSVHVRIYKPVSRPAAGSPLIVYAHGGGFCSGSLSNSESTVRRFVQSSGAVVISVDYRLAPEHPFPAATDDCWAVVKWAASNASSLGADTSKGFVLGGVSAGGNLAVVTGLRAIEEGLSPPITGLALLVPSLTDYRALPEEYKEEIVSYEQNRDAPGMGTALIKLFLDNYNPDSKSPMYDVLANQQHVGGLPPVYMQVCGMDPFRDEELIFERLLRTKHNIKTKVDVYPGLPHAFWTLFPKFPGAAKAAADAVDGMSWLLQQGQ